MQAIDKSKLKKKLIAIEYVHKRTQKFAEAWEQDAKQNEGDFLLIGNGIND